MASDSGIGCGNDTAIQLVPLTRKKMDLNHPFFRKEKSFLKPPFLGFLCYVLGGEM